MLPQIPVEYTAEGGDAAARTGNVYQPNYLLAGARPGMHTAYVQNQGQYLVMSQQGVLPAQHVLHPAVQVMPQMNMAVVCSPMVDIAVPSSAAMHGVGAAMYRPVYAPATAVQPQQQPQQRSRPGYGSNMWATVHGVGASNHVAAAVGQATPVEDILQLLRSMPRGTSSIPVVADSLRYLDSRCGCLTEGAYMTVVWPG